MGNKFHKVYVVTVPANTTAMLKIIDSVALSGKVTQMNIDIPDGWNYNTGIQIRIGRHVFPVEDTEDGQDTFTGNDTDLQLRPDIDVKEEKVSIHGLNNDTVYSHSCVVTLEIDPEFSK